MQRRIQQLSPQLANQIAAGEVVERPASVVKELLENSIDAGADEIELEVEQGGAKLIRVSDNGRGIQREDLPLAVAPHATSKIYTQKELEQIASLGFRGEALASIASVSRFSLASRYEAAEQGWQLGPDGELLPAPQPQGTRVEVRDLFHNTPARRKFLRTERTEFLHIEEVVKRLALSRFDIAFTLIHNGRQVLRLRPARDAASQGRRVGEVLGRGFMQQALSLEYEAAGMRLWGWLAPPEASRSQADSQYFYLNGRMIRDKLVNHAVRQAHQGLLEPGRHPAYVLYLKLDPGQVDINVHPTKHEVRFRESRMAHDFIFRALQRALSSEGSPEPQHTDLEVAAASTSVESAALPQASASQSRFGATPGPARVAEQQAFYARIFDAEKVVSQRKVRAILYDRFLLVEGTEGPGLLALAPSRQAVLLHHARQSLGKEGRLRSQPLLVPYSTVLDKGESERVLRQVQAEPELGLQLERLGEETLVLRRVPAFLNGVEPAEVLRRLLALVSKPEQETLLEALVALAVESLPVKGLDEAQRLLGQLEGLPDKGKAHWRALPLAMLERWFASAPTEAS